MFKKSFKKLIWDYFKLFFTQILTKMNVPGKKGCVSFYMSNYLHLCKNSDETNDSFLRKTLNK